MVGIVMGSKNDWTSMLGAADVLHRFEVPFEARVVSAHRTPNLLYEYARTARGRLDYIIAGAGGAAHLPGMLASLTAVPVLAVPMFTPYFHGMDSLLSIVQMPRGEPVPTFCVGKNGATNAALFVVRLMAAQDGDLLSRLQDYRNEQAQEVIDTELTYSPEKNF